MCGFYRSFLNVREWCNGSNVWLIFSADECPCFPFFFCSWSFIKRTEHEDQAFYVLEAPHVPLWIKHQILLTKQCCSINTSEWMVWWIKSVIPICKLLRETPTHCAWETVSCEFNTATIFYAFFFKNLLPFITWKLHLLLALFNFKIIVTMWQ